MCALPQHIIDLMTECVGCNRCLSVCPSYKHGGCNPHMSLIGKDPNTAMCIGCGKCSEVCRHTNPKLVMMYLKAEAVQAKVPDAFVRHGLVIPRVSDEWKKEVPEYREGSDVYIMPGCIVEGKLPFLEYAGVKAFQAVGVDAGVLPKSTCCMYPIPLRQLGDMERGKHKRELRTKSKGRDMVALCAGCTIELSLDGIYAPHVSTYLSKYLERIRSLPGLRGMKVALEPGCAAERFATDFRAIVEATGAEIVNRSCGCCGKSVKDVSGKLMEERQEECQGADAIILGCPNCEVFYDSVPGGIPCLHLVELIALAAGDSETQRFHKLKLGKTVWGE